MIDVYAEHGYKSREHYLDTLAEDLGLDVDVVYMTADLYGLSEDFDGLVTTLQDYAEGMF